MNHVRMPDPIFAEPRLAALYDIVDGDRSDLDVYAEIVDELEASSILDVGCGTGSFACRLALRGATVVGVDPAMASLDVARGKRGAERVHWIHGDTSGLPALEADLAIMTGNVAQVFLTDTEWTQVLTAVRHAVCDTGWLVLETRDPARRAWKRWTKEHTYRELLIPNAGRVDTWTDLTRVQEPLVSFRQTFHFHTDGVELVSDSTLRFRSQAEIAESLGLAGFALQEIRDAPDRPGLELVCVAQRAARSST